MKQTGSQIEFKNSYEMIYLEQYNVLGSRLKPTLGSFFYFIIHHTKVWC